MTGRGFRLFARSGVVVDPLDDVVGGVVVVDGAHGGVGQGDAGVVAGLIAVRDADVDVAVDAVRGRADVGRVLIQSVVLLDADGRSRDLREAAGVGAVDVEHGVTRAFGEFGRAGDVVLVEDDVGRLSDVDGGGEVEHFILFGRAGDGGNARDKRGHSQDCEDAFHLFLICRFCSILEQNAIFLSCTSSERSCLSSYIITKLKIMSSVLKRV